MTDPAAPPVTADFPGAVFSLLLVMQQEKLPHPLSLGWDVSTDSLDVQVLATDFETWARTLVGAVVKTTEHEGQTHLHADGLLWLNDMRTRVRLVAVSHGPRAEVGEVRA
jgi:hypothetical protein